MSKNYNSQDETLHTPPLGIKLAQILIKQKRKFQMHSRRVLPIYKLALASNPPHSLPANDSNLKYEKDCEHIYAIRKHETHHAYDEELAVEKNDMP